MKLMMISLFDAAIASYMQPMAVVNKEHAMRIVSDVRRQPGPIQDHAKDFSCWQLGTFDDSSGQVEGLATPVLLFRLDQE